MDKKLRYGAPGIAALLQVGLLLGAAPVAAADYWLCAKAGTVDMPGMPGIPVWSYVLDDNNNLADGCPTTAVVALPGPPLNVPPGDTTLTVHLRNDLTLEPTSIVIPGQTAAMTPVWTDGTSGPRTNATQRVRSFTQEAAPNGGTADYNWTNVRPGTYLYHSGSHPQVQVQMGLYGALTKNFAVGPNQAYDGVPYDSEVTLLFSEIDPEQHAAIAAGTFGTASAPATTCQDTSGQPLPMTSTLCYKPKYFLINGQPHQANAAPLANLTQGKSTLLRLLNAGNRAYVPLLQGMHMKMVAEDGNRYQYRQGGTVYPRDQYQYSTWLAALKTTDAIVVPVAAGSHAIYDRRLNTVSAGTQDGGMFGVLAVAVSNEVDVAITKTHGLTGVFAAGSVNYTIVVTNPGPGTVTGASVTDTLPAELTGVSWTCTATAGSGCPASGSGSIAAALVNLAVGGAATFNVNGTVNAAAGTVLSNTATVAVPAPMIDPNVANNSATDTTTILAAQANLGITKTDGLASVAPGNPLTYTIVASNAGPSAVTGATVTDTMPAALINVSWTCAASAGSGCGAANGSGSIATTANLASGGAATFTVNATVLAAATGTLSNTASVSVPVGTVDPVSTNNSATDSTTIQAAVSAVAYFSTAGNTVVPGVTGANDDADIYAYRSDATFARVFDASVAPASVPAGANVDAFIYNGPNDIYLSFSTDNTNLPGLAGVQDEDIVHWNGSVWRMFFDGSVAGLGGVAALDVDAFALAPNGALILSSTGTLTTPSVQPQDLWYCAPGTFGFGGTTCVPTLHFDANPDIGLAAASENLNYVKVVPNGDIQLRTTGNFATYNPPGTPAALSGTTANVFSCNVPTTGAASACTSFSNVLTLPALGTGSMDAIYLP